MSGQGDGQTAGKPAAAQTDACAMHAMPIVITPPYTIMHRLVVIQALGLGAFAGRGHDGGGLVGLGRAGRGEWA